MRQLAGLVDGSTNAGMPVLQRQYVLYNAAALFPVVNIAFTEVFCKRR